MLYVKGSVPRHDGMGYHDPCTYFPSNLIGEQHIRVQTQVNADRTG